MSKNAAAEKNSRISHIPKLHVWPAARPGGACRAVLLASLLPDPSDKSCPKDFIKDANKILEEFYSKSKSEEDLKEKLLKFIGQFANWTIAHDRIWVDAAIKLVSSVYPESPVVVDPFAGGGSIPLESLRIGCDAISSDLNPVACLIEKVLLEDLPKYRDQIIEELPDIIDKIRQSAVNELSKYYPRDSDGSIPVAYLWARCVQCEQPNCGCEIPLIRSFWLSQKPQRLRAMRYKIINEKRKPRIVFEIFTPKSINEVQDPLVNRGNGVCPNCNQVLETSRLRSQLIKQNGGSDIMLDHSKNIIYRSGGAFLLAVAILKDGRTTRYYRLPTKSDFEAIYAAQVAVRDLDKKYKSTLPTPFPNEILPTMSGTFNAPLYGMNRWRDIYTARQLLAINCFTSQIQKHAPEYITPLVALLISKVIDLNNSLTVWHTKGERPAHMLSRWAIPMKWDFPEAIPIGQASGSIVPATKRTLDFIKSFKVSKQASGVILNDAKEPLMPDESVDVWFTDPPYYNAIPYADLSDFFFVWLKRALPENTMFKDKYDDSNELTPKDQELCEMAGWDKERYGNKDSKFFEDGMAEAFRVGKNSLKENGIGLVVFAHKTTEGWEALLNGMISKGLVITASWPIVTEMSSRLRARDSAALSASVHLVCRPRPEDAPIGEWEDILRQLPKRMKEWVIRLDKEGIHGADLVFSCIGPALELFSKYRKVETAEGEQVKLGPDDEANGEAAKRGYLSYIWEVVGRTALELVLSGDDEGIGTLEEDARLCALFLWTHQSTETQNEKKENDDVPKITGLSLPFDIVRRFAQPLGIHLPDWEDRVIKIEKGMVKMIPVMKRAKQLFGEDITVVASQFELQAKEDSQIELSLALETGEAPEIGGKHRGGAIVGEEFEKANTATTLDRVHAAMLLQAAGKTNALRALIKQEVARGSEFLRLANSLSALFPTGIEEKRLLDAMLLAVPR